MSSDDSNWRSGPRAVPRGPDVRDDSTARRLIHRTAETLNVAGSKQVTELRKMVSAGDHMARVRHRSGSFTDLHFHEDNLGKVGAMEHHDRTGTAIRYSGQRGELREQQAEVTMMAAHNAGGRAGFQPPYSPSVMVPSLSPSSAPSGASQTARRAAPLAVPASQNPDKS